MAEGGPGGLATAGSQGRLLTSSLPPHPSSAGLLPLPAITMTAAQLGQQAEVTRGGTLFVDRPLEQQA